MRKENHNLVLLFSKDNELMIQFEQAFEHEETQRSVIGNSTN